VRQEETSALLMQIQGGVDCQGRHQKAGKHRDKCTKVLKLKGVQISDKLIGFLAVSYYIGLGMM
jgi:hypothetical protein